jgi:hypothetical protein
MENGSRLKLPIRSRQRSPAVHGDVDANSALAGGDETLDEERADAGAVEGVDLEVDRDPGAVDRRQHGAPGGGRPVQ